MATESELRYLVRVNDRDLKDLQRRVKDVNKTFGDTRGYSSANRGLLQVTRGAAAGSGAFRSLGRQIAFASSAFLGAAGFTAVVTRTIQAAANFERTLNTFQAVAEATGKQMQDVGKQAKILGRDLTLPAVSAADAATVMTELARGGLSVKQSMAAAKGTLQLATAATMDNVEAARIAARALGAFGLSGDQAGRVADVLANAANKSAGEMSDYAIALQQSATVSKQLGLSVEDTVAALAQMAHAGLVGSDAGTSFRVMLQRLIPQTTRASDEMAELGIKWKDAHGNLIPFRDMVSQYSVALMRLSPAQRQQSIQTIFGTDAQRAANIVLLGGVKAHDEYQVAIRKQGTAADVAKAKMKGFSGAMEAIRSIIETAQIEIGTAMLPALTKMGREFGAFMSQPGTQKRIREFAQTMGRELPGLIRGLAEVLKTVAGIVADLARVAKTVSDAVGGWKNAFTLVLSGLLANKLIKIVAQLRLMGTTATVATLGPTVAGIGGVGTSAEKAGKKVGGLRAGLAGLARLGVIAIAIDLIINKPKFVEDWNLDRSLIEIITGRKPQEIIQGVLPGGGAPRPWKQTAPGIEANKQLSTFRQRSGKSVTSKANLNSLGQALAHQGYKEAEAVTLLRGRGYSQNEVEQMLGGFRAEWKLIQKSRALERKRARGQGAGAAVFPGAFPTPHGSRLTGAPTHDVAAGITQFASGVGARAGMGSINVLSAGPASGRAPGGKVAGSNRVSLHGSGRAIDLGPYYGKQLTQLGQAALMQAGMPAAEARKATGGLYNVNGYEIIFNSNIGGNHWNHVHIGSASPQRQKPPKPSKIDVPALQPKDVKDKTQIKDKTKKVSELLPRQIRAQIAAADETTKTAKDDIKAWERALAFLTKLRGTVKKGGEKWIEVTKEITQAKGTLADLRKGREAEPFELPLDIRTRLERFGGGRNLRGELKALQDARAAFQKALGGAKGERALDIRKDLNDIIERIRGVKEELLKAGSAASEFQQALAASRTDAKELQQVAASLPKGLLVAVRDSFGRISEQLTPGDIQARIAKIQKQLGSVANEDVRAKLQSDLDRYRDLIGDAIEKVREEIEKRRGALEDAFSELSERAFDAFDARTSGLLDGIRTRLQGTLDIIETAREALTPAEAALNAFRNQREARENAQRSADAHERVTKAQERMNRLLSVGASPRRMKEVLRELQEAQEELAEVGLDAQGKTLEQRAEIERKAADEEAERKRKAAEDLAAEEEKQLNASRAELRRGLQKRVNDLQRGILAGNYTAEQALGEFNGILGDFGVNVETSGFDIGLSFAGGFLAAFPAFRNAVDLYRNYLIQNGFLVGETMVTPLPPITFVPGRGSRSAQPMAVGGIVRKPTLALLGEAGPEAVIPLGRGGGLGDVHLHVHVGTVIGNTLDGAARELATPMRRELDNWARRNGYSGLRSR